MRMTVYGNNATCPEADGACSCFLVEAGGKRISLDMGNGSLAKLQKDIDLASLDMIVISHLHFDHFGDLFCAKYQLESRRAYGEAIPKIPLLAPRLPAWAQAELCTNEVFEPHVIEDGLRFCLGDVALEFTGTVHLIESYGVRLSAEGKTLAYSGDAGACPQLARIAAGADLFLCEATLTDGMHAEEGHHLRAATAGRIAAENGVGRLLLTHCHAAQAQTALREARACFARTELTAIGETCEVE